ncbi:uncharacterized protein LOC111014968 [Momordica charantia]|uniref:Uncharacterized protein LOC111014968 n=1 Tax=Momordica charantia TaxID=3673 RepID=A0A6J1CWX0_MOMCH|nr:uncharacterized protein LOC111014968 [Momordica charantia]
MNDRSVISDFPYREQGRRRSDRDLKLSAIFQLRLARKCLVPWFHSLIVFWAFVGRKLEAWTLFLCFGPTDDGLRPNGVNLGRFSLHNIGLPGPLIWQIMKKLA